MAVKHITSNKTSLSVLHMLDDYVALFGPCAPTVRTYVDVKMVYRDNEWFTMRHY